MVIRTSVKMIFLLFLLALADTTGRKSITTRNSENQLGDAIVKKRKLGDCPSVHFSGGGGMIKPDEEHGQCYFSFFGWIGYKLTIDADEGDIIAVLDGCVDKTAEWRKSKQVVMSARHELTVIYDKATRDMPYRWSDETFDVTPGVSPDTETITVPVDNEGTISSAEIDAGKSTLHVWKLITEKYQNIALKVTISMSFNSSASLIIFNGENCAYHKWLFNGDNRGSVWNLRSEANRIEVMFKGIADKDAFEITYQQDDGPDMSEPLSTIMKTRTSLAVGFAALSAGALYWAGRRDTPTAYDLNAHLDHQSQIIDEETGARCSPPQMDAPTEYDHVLTVYDVFEQGLLTAEHEACLGHRGSTNDPYRWNSYAEINRKVNAVAALLDTLSSNGCRLIGIQSRNCPEWLVTQLACAARGFVTVPLYETFGAEALSYVLQQTKLEIVFCYSRTEAESLQRSPSPHLRHVVIFNQASPDGKAMEEVQTNNSIQLHSFVDWLTHHTSNSAKVQNTSKPDDLFMICYTSGTCGNPKGVQIRHGQFVRTLKSLRQRLEDANLLQRPVHISYLPLAHILEQLASMATILFGGRIGFLSSGFPGILQDMQALRPTYWFTVPRVLARLHATMTQRVAVYPGLGRLVDYAIDRKLGEQNRGVFSRRGFWDALFFQKVRRAVGDRLSAIVCGGAPIPTNVLRFARAAFSCPVLAAYGLTESCGVVSLGYFGDTGTEHVGALLPGLNARLVDVKEMDLCVADTGCGELLIKGPNCTNGYFGDDTATAELINPDGWLYTGDLARWDERGSLQIVGRLKASFKLSQGEYVSPEKIESVYQLCPLVSQVFVDGRATADYPVCVVVPETTAFLTQFDRIAASCVTELCTDNHIRQTLLDELNRIGRSHGLNGFELAKRIHLTDSPFTIENRLLTANLKLSRVNLRKHFSSVVEGLYTESSMAA